MILNNKINNDLDILCKYIYRKFLEIKHIFLDKTKLSKTRLEQRFSEREDDFDFLKTLASHDGASKLGGIFMGTKNINSFPARIYRIERSNEIGQKDFLYIAYIDRTNNQFQVVVTDDWNQLHFYISNAINNNKKISIDIVNTKGGGISVKTSRLGRKMV